MPQNNWSRWPDFDAEQIAAVEAVLRSGKVNYWTGEQARAFEREFAAACGSRHGIALANGTLALELALHVLGIGAGDEVVVTPRSFIASAARRGAVRRTAGVRRRRPGEPEHHRRRPSRAVLSPRTKAIIAVHLAGWPCDLEPIMALARSAGLRLIEDCAQAHGATYRGRPVGSFGDVAAFSFCQDKIITTGGEGGMLVTDDEALWRKAWAYKDHGKSFDAVYQREHPPGFRWLHESFGSNWRITEMQAAIGRVQLTRLTGWVARRRRNAAAILTAALRPLPALRADAAAGRDRPRLLQILRLRAAGAAGARLVARPHHDRDRRRRRALLQRLLLGDLSREGIRRARPAAGRAPAGRAQARRDQPDAAGRIRRSAMPTSRRPAGRSARP